MVSDARKACQTGPVDLDPRLLYDQLRLGVLDRGKRNAVGLRALIAVWREVFSREAGPEHFSPNRLSGNPENLIPVIRA